MSLDATKPVFRVFYKARLKPVSSHTETSYNIEISLEASLDMILFSKRVTKVLISLYGLTKALISLRRCAGWSAHLLFGNSKERFSRIKAQKMLKHNIIECFKN